MISRILPVYFFSLECLYLYLLLFLFYSNGVQLPTTFSFLSVTMFGSLSLFYLLKQKQINLVIPFLIGVIGGLIGYILGLTIITSMICGIFLTYRLDAFTKDSSLWLEERRKLPIIYYSTSSIVFIVGWIFNYSNMNWLYAVTIIFMLLFIFGKFLQQAVGKQTINNFSGLFSTTTIAVLLTGIFMLLLPLVKWFFLKIFEGIVSFFGFIAMPLFNFIEGLFIQPKPRKSEENPNINIDKLPESHTHNYLLDAIPSWIWPLLLVLIIVVIIFLIWQLIRKYIFNKIEINFHETPIEVGYSTSPETIRKTRRYFRHPTPTEHIRKLFYQLQTFASKHNMGRNEHETIDEWFKRINIPINTELTNAYDFVRYGKGDLKGNEIFYENEIQKIKSRIKEIRHED